MKALKLNISILIFITISLLPGCNDNLLIPEKTEITEQKTGAVPMNFGEGVYREKFTLNAGESKIFNYGNTNLILIHSYMVSNCDLSTRDLKIRTSIQVDGASLPCSWKKQGDFGYEDLIIINTSSQQKLISVNLRGLH